MPSEFRVYNTLSRKKELFEPLNPPFVGLYACGPTVYSDAHLGHARQAITFDVLFRTLSYLGYKVRYVRNITDVGHLVGDADEGEDKILKKARLESLEPMEVVQHYMNAYHDNMRALNVLPPSIEPRASGHMIEQQELVRKIMDAGYAYEVNGSVYFDVEQYNRDHHYGILSGRKIEDLMANTRALGGQSEKRNPLDFSLWKKADPTHLMRWSSPWGEGYPGWHLECSAMSTKYLGSEFDIHGGGMDLLFPHHECEIAQNVTGYGKPAVRYWMHNNMITINGQKMGRSLGNFFTLDQLFSGEHELLERAYHPMAIRFFILQAHYRSTLDFSNDALQGSRKGLDRLLAAIATLDKIKPVEIAADHNYNTVDKLEKECEKALFDDLNTAKLIAQLLDWVTTINNLAIGVLSINEAGLEKIRRLYKTMVFEVLGILPLERDNSGNELTTNLVEMIIGLRNEAKEGKDYATADMLRDRLKALGIILRDHGEGTDWEIDNHV
jgi:cysteinyl-tRNA synthetase